MCPIICGVTGGLATVLMFAIAVGLAAAAGVVVFYRAIDLVFELFFAWPARAFPGLPLSRTAPSSQELRSPSRPRSGVGLEAVGMG